MKNQILQIILVASVLLVSCKKDKDDPIDDPIVTQSIAIGFYDGSYDYPSNISYDGELQVTASTIVLGLGLGSFDYTDDNNGSIETSNGHGTYTTRTMRFWLETDSGDVVFNGNFRN